MTTVNRFSCALALSSFALLTNAHAQTPSVSTVNITPDEQKVRVAAVGDVLDMRVAVSDEAGDVVFESGAVTGDHLDWAMSAPQGGRVPPGTYNLTVTYRTPSGKLKRRVEQVLVTEEVAASSAAPEEPTPQAVGTISGQGTSGKIAKFTGANTVGNSVLAESSGRIGLGTAAPAQSLHVLGASSRLRLQSSGAASLTSTEYVTNNRLWQAGAGGSTNPSGVAGKFFVYDQTANQYRIVIDTAGNFGVGTVTPTSKLTVSGNVQIMGAGNGIKFPDGSIQTKAIAGTINGTGTTNRLAKFTGPNSFGNSAITEVSGKVGIGTASPARPLHIASGQLRLSSASGDIEFGETADLIAHATTASPSGDLPALRVNVGTGLAPAFTVLNNGNVGVGTTQPQRALQIGERTDALFTIEPSPGSPIAGYIRFGDGTGWRLQIARQREFSGGPLITSSPNSLAGAILTIDDNGQVRQHIGQFTTRFFSGGVYSVCRTESGGDGVSGTLAACSSSLRYKTAVQPFAAGLELVGRLRPISFTWKDGGVRDLGLAAEDVARVEPLLVTYDDEGQVDGVKYDRLSAVFINAVREQQEQIREQQKLIEQQAWRSEEQARQIEQLRAQLNRVRRTVSRGRAGRR